MSLAMTAFTYDDFKTAVHALPRKFTIFYSFSSPGQTIQTIKIWAVSTDMDAIVEMLEVTTPSTFATDFPNAVQLTSTQNSQPFSIFSSVFTKDAA